MEICFVNINAYSLFNSKSKAPIGGAEVDLYTLANYLSKRNKVDFIVGDWGQKDDIEQYKKIKVYKSFSLQKNIWNYIKAPFILWKQMKQLNTDIYISESAGAEIGIMALFCKIKNKKFIYRTAHDKDCNKEFINKNGFIGRIYKYGLENADMVITQNKDNQKMLWKNHKIKAKILKNCYNIQKNDIEEKKYILWVARCIIWKRPELFLNIIKKFPKEKFVMIAPMVAYNKKLFRQIQIKANKLSNLKFIEKVDFFEIQKYFNEAKLFIGTSDYEGFPNTYLQSCMGRTPIISLRVNPDKFITKNNLGYCANGNFSTMVDQIKNILSNQKDWQEKSNNALKYVQKNHDIKVIGEKWAEAIDNLKQEKY